MQHQRHNIQLAPQPGAQTRTMHSQVDGQGNANELLHMLYLIRSHLVDDEFRDEVGDGATLFAREMLLGEVEKVGRVSYGESDSDVGLGD